MSTTHALIIKHDRHPLDHEPPDIEFSIECPGVTDACHMWVECDRPRCREDNPNLGEGVVHGKRHLLFPGSGTWSVPTDTCYLVIADEMPDAADYLATKQKLGAGRYLIGHDFDEGCIADFQLVEEAAQ